MRRKMGMVIVNRLRELAAAKAGNLNRQDIF